jgi:hypothetical protein
LLAGRARAAVARVWRFRERVELEAADQFERLATELERVGADRAVIELAHEAAADERVHAGLCRNLVDRFEPGLEPLAPALGLRLGPRHRSRRSAALYAAVAMSCVTETLSAALLLHMREAAVDEPVAATVHHILRDEIDHSRLGWAHLATEARRGDVSWLADHVPAMLRDALAADLEPMTAASDDLSAYGILPAARVHEIARQTVAEVIAPGLARHGIAVAPASDHRWPG